MNTKTRTHAHTHTSSHTHTHTPCGRYLASASNGYHIRGHQLLQLVWYTRVTPGACDTHTHTHTGAIPYTNAHTRNTYTQTDIHAPGVALCGGCAAFLSRSASLRLLHTSDTHTTHMHDTDSDTHIIRNTHTHLLRALCVFVLVVQQQHTVDLRVVVHTVERTRIRRIREDRKPACVCVCR